MLREAPLVLLPVSLKRDPRRSTFELAIREEDITTNQAIQERLRADFGITLPSLPETGEWRPTEYFASVREAIAIKTRWSIDPERVELGFYSFSKLLMIRDLEPAAWGDKPIIDHPLLRALLSEGFREEPLAIPNDAKLDTLYAPADLIHVVDADSSQTIVIETARAGRNLVVQGPPGTGKSQTITNIIANAVHDGKSVLFVAEKVAALDVVHGRLRRAGLGPVCLELHKGANKRAVLAEVESTLNYHAIEPDAEAETTRLTELRTTLNAVDARMHALVGDTGLTPFQALSRLISAAEAGVAGHTALLAEATKWSASDYGSIVEATVRLSEITATAGSCFNHPYYGVGAKQLQPLELARLMAPLAGLAEAATALAQWAETIAHHLGIATEITLEACSTLLAILRIVETLPVSAAEVAETLPKQNLTHIINVTMSGFALGDLRSALTSTFVDAAWEIQATSLRLSLTSGLSFFGRFGANYRNASKILGSMLKIPLPKKAEARTELADRLIELARRRADLMAEDRAMATMLPLHGRGEKTDFQTLHTAALVVLDLSTQTSQPRVGYAIAFAKGNLAKDHIQDVTRLVDRLNHAADAVFPVLELDLSKAFRTTGRDRIPLRSLAAKAYLWRDNETRFDEWRRLAAADKRLRDLSGAVLADALANGTMPPEMTNAVLECTYAEAVWSKARAATPELQNFYGPHHDAIADEFRTLETKRRNWHSERCQSA